MSTEFIINEKGNESQQGYGFYIKGVRQIYILFPNFKISIETSSVASSLEFSSAKTLLNVKFIMHIILYVFLYLNANRILCRNSAGETSLALACTTS